MSNLTLTLDQRHINSYHREGYLVLNAITTAQEVQWLRVLYDDLFAKKAGREEGNQFDLAGTDEDNKEAVLPQIVNVVNYAPELTQTIYRQNADRIAKQLLGAEAEFMGDHAILKPARTGADTPWHQDEAYWHPDFEYDSLSIWMPLQDATIENGCMQFIPASHLLEVLPHHSIGNDPRVHGLEADSVNATNAVACPILAGGATIHHCRTLHYAGPNRSSQPRRAYILLYGLPKKPRAEARNFYWQDKWQTARQARKQAAEKD